MGQPFSQSCPLAARPVFPLREQNGGTEAESSSDSALIPQREGKGLGGGGPSLRIIGSAEQSY